MWTKTTAVLIVFMIASCSADGTVKLSCQKLVGNTFGDKCTTTNNGAVTKCQVKRGEEVTFTGNIAIKGNGHLTVVSMSCTIQFTREKEIVAKVPTCLKNNNILVINGKCCIPKIANGDYTLEPFTFKAPNTEYPGAKVMDVTCDIIWSDKSKTQDKLVGTTSITLK